MDDESDEDVEDESDDEADDESDDESDEESDDESDDETPPEVLLAQERARLAQLRERRDELERKVAAAAAADAESYAASAAALRENVASIQVAADPAADLLDALRGDPLGVLNAHPVDDALGDPAGGAGSFAAAQKTTSAAEAERQTATIDEYLTRLAESATRVWYTPVALAARGAALGAHVSLVQMCNDTLERLKLTPRPAEGDARPVRYDGFLDAPGMPTHFVRLELAPDADPAFVAASLP